MLMLHCRRNFTCAKRKVLNDGKSVGKYTKKPNSVSWGKSKNVQFLSYKVQQKLHIFKNLRIPWRWPTPKAETTSKHELTNYKNLAQNVSVKFCVCENEHLKSSHFQFYLDIISECKKTPHEVLRLANIPALPISDISVIHRLTLIIGPRCR